MLICYITCPDEEVATRVASDLVDKDLCACVNIVNGVKSVYKWEGKVHADPEVLCIVKTTSKKFNAMKSRVERIHPYDVPEIISKKVDKANKDYFDWVLEIDHK